MTKRAKWAFADKKGAEAFIKENGGKLAYFDDAMKATYEDMYADTKMIREKRAKRKMMQQGVQAVTLKYIKASGTCMTMRSSSRWPYNPWLTVRRTEFS